MQIALGAAELGRDLVDAQIRVAQVLADEELRAHIHRLGPDAIEHRVGFAQRQQQQVDQRIGDADRAVRRQLGRLVEGCMLEQAAAKRWNVPATEVKAVNHEVVHSASGRKLGFGELAADAAKESVPAIEGLKLKDPKDFRYLGKGQVGIVDLHDITTGKAQYGADVRLPGMIWRSGRRFSRICACSTPSALQRGGWTRPVRTTLIYINRTMRSSLTVCCN